MYLASHLCNNFRVFTKGPTSRGRYVGNLIASTCGHLDAVAADHDHPDVVLLRRADLRRPGTQHERYRNDVLGRTQRRIDTSGGESIDVLSGVWRCGGVRKSKVGAFAGISAP